MISSSWIDFQQHIDGLNGLDPTDTAWNGLKSDVGDSHRIRTRRHVGEGEFTPGIGGGNSPWAAVPRARLAARRRMSRSLGP